MEPQEIKALSSAELQALLTRALAEAKGRRTNEALAYELNVDPATVGRWFRRSLSEVGASKLPLPTFTLLWIDHPVLPTGSPSLPPRLSDRSHTLWPAA